MALSKSFNRASHNIPLSKMAKLGHIQYCYLDSWYPNIFFNGSPFLWRKILHGVPHGLVLGFVLNIFINALEEEIEELLIKFSNGTK